MVLKLRIVRGNWCMFDYEGYNWGFGPGLGVSALRHYIEHTKRSGYKGYYEPYLDVLSQLEERVR